MMHGASSLLPSPLEGINNLWMFWSNPPGQSPPDILRMSIRLWQTFHPTWRVHVLDTESASHYGFDWSTEFSPDRQTVNLTFAGQTDMLRTHLLTKYGGVWADVDVLPLGNIQTVYGPLVDQHGYYVPHAPSTYTDRQIMSWFMMAQAGTPTFGALRERLRSYLRAPRARVLQDAVHRDYIIEHVPAEYIGPTVSGDALLREIERHGHYPYFWAFYLFNQLLNDRPGLNATWQALNDDPLRSTWDQITPLLAKVNRRNDCWRTHQPALERLIADFDAGSWDYLRARDLQHTLLTTCAARRRPRDGD